MNVFLCQSRCTCLFIVLANIVVMTTSLDHASGVEYPVNYFSGEFENFLHGLGSMVYKYKNPARQTPDTRLSIHEYQDATPSEPTNIYRRNHNLVGPPKEMIKDVLMMKLVSYYEDKYKVTDKHNVDTTTVSSLIRTNKMQSLTSYKQRPRSETYLYNDYKTRPQTSKRVLNIHQAHNEIAEVEVL